jgi:PRC-barrel domain
MLKMASWGFAIAIAIAPLMLVPARAQQPAPAGAGTANPCLGETARSAARAGMPQLSNGFVCEMSAGAMRLSKMVGAPAIGLDHYAIGKIDDVLMNRDGKIEAVVLQVGGFLGVGAKDVALPYDAVLWNTGDVTRAPGPSASLSPADAPAQPATGGAERMPGAQVSTEALRARDEDRGREVNPATGPVATGSTERVTAPVVGPSGGPVQAMVRLTKADLEGAPAFRYDGAGASRQ